MNDANARVNALKSGEVDGGWMLPTEAIAAAARLGTGDVLLRPEHRGLEPDRVATSRARSATCASARRCSWRSTARASSRRPPKGYGEVDERAHDRVRLGRRERTRPRRRLRGLEEYPYDLEAAKQLIEEAGATGEEIVLATAPISSDFAVISQATAAAAESIGLKATIETVTPNAYTALFSDPAAREGIDLFYTVWYLSSPDPLEMYGVLRTGEFSNYGNWSDPEFDQVVNEAIAIDDPAARSEKTAEAQRIANEQLPWLPLYTAPMSVFLGERITGRRALDRVPVLPMGGHNWRTLALRGSVRTASAERRSHHDHAPPGGRQARRPAAHAVPRITARLLLAVPRARATPSASCCGGASPAPRRSPRSPPSTGSTCRRGSST